MASLRTETRLVILQLEAFVSNLKEPWNRLLMLDLGFQLHLEQSVSFSVGS